MPNIFDQAAQAPRSANPFAQVDLSKSVANTFDFGRVAGGMQGASGVGVSDNMLASKQLGNILAKDNPLMVQARTRAQEAAAARGLGNSSIAVGAGQTAMNDVALPLAQQDAGTFFDAAKFNASESNAFARDANAFGRQAAMAQFGALSDAEVRNHQYGFDSYERGQDRSLTRSESLLDRAQQLEMQDRDFGFRASDREDTQGWQGQENREDRTWRGDQAGLDREFNRTENQTNRTFQRDERVAGQGWQAEQNQANRDFQTADREDTQAFNQSLQTQSQEFQASQQTLQNEFTRSMQRSGMPDQMLGNFASGMQQAIGNIMSDPNMTPEQKTSAMENYYAYANSQMSWMATFYNTPMPNMRTGGSINPTPGTTPTQATGGPNVGPVTTPPQNQVAIPADPIFSAAGNYDRRGWA